MQHAWPRSIQKQNVIQYPFNDFFWNHYFVIRLLAWPTLPISHLCIISWKKYGKKECSINLVLLINLVKGACSISSRPSRGTIRTPWKRLTHTYIHLHIYLLGRMDSCMGAILSRSTSTDLPPNVSALYSHCSNGFNLITFRELRLANAIMTVSLDSKKISGGIPNRIYSTSRE